MFFVHHQITERNIIKSIAEKLEWNKNIPPDAGYNLKVKEFAKSKVKHQLQMAADKMKHIDALRLKHS